MAPTDTQTRLTTLEAHVATCPAQSARLISIEAAIDALVATVGHSPDTATGRAGVGLCGEVAKLVEAASDDKKRAASGLSWWTKASLIVGAVSSSVVLGGAAYAALQVLHVMR